MPAYLVKQDTNKSGRQLRNGADAMLVFAADPASAKQAAAALYDGDGNVWTGSDATVTEIKAAADFAGWTFKVAVLSDPPINVQAKGDATNNTADKIAALLVTALNATTPIAGAAYDAATNTLTVAATTDALGDQSLQVQLIPPTGVSPIDGLLGAITDGGASGDALTVVLPADNAVIPSTPVPVRQA